MTVAEFRTRFPNATESVVRANCPDYVARSGPPPKPDKTARLSRSPNKSGRKLKSRVPLVRNGGTWSEARYWQAVRSALRRGFRYWRPATLALEAARIASRGPRGRKWLYLCAGCEKLFLRKHVEIDHHEPCGALTKLEHIPEFLLRLTPENSKAYQVLCLKCHPKKTKSEITARRPASARATCRMRDT